MSESASLTRAELRKRDTASQLTAVTRRLTADLGLTGFTIEQVCDEVGISRRTFFNYFPSKIEAILGIDETAELVVFLERFHALGSRGWPAVIDDLISLAGEVLSMTAFSPEEHWQVMRAIEREPKLLARFMGAGREREELLLAIVAEREGVAVDDPHARAAVEIVVLALRSTGARLSDPRVAADIGGALLDTVTALRAVLVSPAHEKDQS